MELKTASDQPGVRRDQGPLVRMTSVGKSFGLVRVLDGVDFEVRSGETHVLAGENGAGKSTLIRILAGVYTDYRGEVAYGGVVARPAGPLEANRLGVAVIHQELSLIGTMSVADNLFLGRPATRFGLVDDAAQQRMAERWLAELGLDIDVRLHVDTFPIGTQQAIEIAKALSINANVIVMDEPTSTLSDPEAERLFGVIEKLKREGRGVVYISHKMDEIERLADRITVLRDGYGVGTWPAADLPPRKLIQKMIGRRLDEQIPVDPRPLGGTRLEVERFTVAGRSGGAPLVSNVNLSVSAGEIVGIGGLQGCGASDLMLGLFGAYGSRATGNCTLDGARFTAVSPRESVRSGVALLTSDRKATGLCLGRSIVENTVMADLQATTWRGWRRPKRERTIAKRHADALNVRTASLEMPVANLSGGNQQKVALAKWLQTEPRLLLIDEPTRGIDVGAKREIYDLLYRLAGEGLAILLITSEMPELLALSDRVYVMHRGTISAELARGTASPDLVLAAAMGQSIQPGSVGIRT